MDILLNSDYEKVIQNLNNNEQNEINLNLTLITEDEENMESNLRLNVCTGDKMDSNFSENAGSCSMESNNHNDEKKISPISNKVQKIDFTSVQSDMENPIHRENEIHNAIYNCSSNIRKTKKRKRHYNVNKNKKWNKVFKRQKSGNTTKNDTENVSQTNRNKHVYTKIPKIIFNNKQVMHRGSGLSKFFLPDKRPRDIIVPPTKFLLGGNISDPLNLNSLQDEALVSMSAATPKSSPITTPPKVEVIIPPNIFDPLHLLDPVDSIEYEKQLVSPIKSRRQRTRKKKAKKYDEDGTDTIDNTELLPDSLKNIEETPKNFELSGEIVETIENHEHIDIGESTSAEEKCKLNRELIFDSNVGNIAVRKRKSSENSACASNCHGLGGGKKIRRFDSKDKIVSPVIPQPGAWKRPPKVQLGAPRNRIRTTSASDTDNAEETYSKRNDACEDIKSDAICVPDSKKESPEHIMSDYESDCGTNIDTDMKLSYRTGKQESIKYQFGNYAGEYCGLQTFVNLSDVRLTVFLRHAYLFKDKDVLDIGCNVGHMTIAVARKLHPKSIFGIDIDKNLIARARQNLSYFQRIPERESNFKFRYKIKPRDNFTHLSLNTEKEGQLKKTKSQTRMREREREYFPVVFPICYGSFPNVNKKTESPWSSPTNNINTKITDSIRNGQSDIYKEPSTFAVRKNESEFQNQVREENYSNGSLFTFPDNVFFRTFNYAVTDESQMTSDKQQYDLILCLSLTKWIHLNFGDAGLKMTFRRMFNQLRPGGKLILEAQNWASYKKRKKLTPNIYNNYKNIEFFPNNFHEYLLSPEVGFSHSYTLGVPRHASKGFYRPIQLYIKGDFTPSQVRWSDTYHPQTPYEPMVRYAHYVDPKRIAIPYNSHWNFNKIPNWYKHHDTPFRYVKNNNTPTHGISSSTSRYYNPLETDSYLPSYDNVVQTRHYCFASPLYSTVWSPPTSGRKSASQTPLFGSIRRVDSDDQDIRAKHLYLTPTSFDGGGSSRSNEGSNNASPQTHHIYAIGSSRSVRELDLDANTNSPKEHVYAFQ